MSSLNTTQDRAAVILVGLDFFHCVMRLGGKGSIFVGVRWDRSKKIKNKSTLVSLSGAGTGHHCETKGWRLEESLEISVVEWFETWDEGHKGEVLCEWNNMRRTYCSFRSVNCFSRVVISSRHSILLLSQSSSSISVHTNTSRHLWHLHHIPYITHPAYYKQTNIFNTRSCALIFKGLFFLLPELSPSSDTDELTVSSSSVLLPSCSGKSTSISSWLLSFFSREWTGIVTWAGVNGAEGLSGKFL